MTSSLAGGRFLITGGTGSFGRVMTRHLLSENATQINVLSRDEAKQDEMRQTLGDSRVRFFLGDIRDRANVDNAMKGVDYVFHAAALKQVPSCEFFPDQAVKTNVIGSQQVIESASEHNVRSVVCLSTDKAVYPINAMGMTKALMEKTAQAFARNNPDSSTAVSVTRYGNVMYSRGSVIPLLVNQIQQNKPLTLTEPTMTRFLMSLEDSVDLVKHAFLHAEPGDLFVRKAPASTVETLARAVSEVMGVKPQLTKIGIRHGEKMHETLLSREEMSKAIDQGGYFRVPLDSRSLDYRKYVEDGDTTLKNTVDYNSSNTQQLSLEETKELICSLPEMQKVLGG